jgi:ATP-dependent RNA helicase DDX27
VFSTSAKSIIRFEQNLWAVLGLVLTKIIFIVLYHFFLIQVTKQLAQFTTVDVALSVGGLDLRLQEAALRKNPDIVIATPGR